MKALRTGLYPAGRLEYGAAILTAAETAVGVTLVQKRLDELTGAHLDYTGKHGAVQADETLVRERQPVLYQLDLEQNNVVEQAAKCLVGDGHTRANPFAVYGIAAPSALMELNFGEKAKALHTLAGMMQADTMLSKATQRTAEAVENTARRMEAELIPFEKLQTNLRTARDAREAAGKVWDNALRALKRAARAAADEGAPGLYTALFGHPIRSKKRQTKEDKQQKTEKPVAPASGSTT